MPRWHVLSLMLLSACAPGPAPVDLPAARILAITRVAVVDVAGGETRPDQTVVIAENRIAAVGSAAQVRVPRGAQIVDGSGKYLIPGLWDMHSHVTHFGPASLPLYLANGVTGVRDMGAVHFSEAKAWRDGIAAGRLLGPRMKIAGPIVERPEWLHTVRGWYEDAGASTEILRERFGPGTPEEAIRWVDSVAALGADHIKVRNWPSREIYQALMARAREHRLPVVGHSNRPFPTVGVATYEHGIFPPMNAPAATRDSLWRRWAANGVAVVPTLAVGAERLEPLDSVIARIDAARNPLYRYVSAEMVGEWRKQYEARRAESPMDWHAARAADIRNLREMRAVGVPILAGSDGTTPFALPGFSMHDELAHLVSLVGMSPLEALRAATLGPTQLLGLADSLGTVEVGKLADLVLLDGDPSVDIRQTQQIRAVIVNGRLLDRRALDRMLRSVEIAER